jgi:hypothetical protein
MAVITYLDLQDYMGKTFTSTQQTAATSLVGALERELGAILGRSLTGLTVTSEAHVLQAGQRQIFLREYPVNTVTALSVGDLGSETAQTLSDYDIYKWGIDGLRIATQGLSALVTYTAGMAATDAQKLEAVMLRASAREMSAMLADAQGLERLSIEGVSMQFANGGQGGFTDDDLRHVRRYHRKGVF